MEGRRGGGRRGEERMRFADRWMYCLALRSLGKKKKNEIQVARLHMYTKEEEEEEERKRER